MRHPHSLCTAVSAFLALLLTSCGGTHPSATARSPLRSLALPAAPTYIVTYHKNSVALDAITRAGGTLVARYDPIGVAVVRSADQGFAQRVRQDARVQGASRTAPFAVKRRGTQAELAPLTAPQGRPAQIAPAGTSLTGEQWDMVQIRAPQAQAVTPGSRSVLVGDLDTGLDSTHPDLAANVDFASSASCVSGVPDPTPSAWKDTDGHGTHTAGTIAAASDGFGITGVAPNVRIAGVRVGDDTGLFYPEAVVCGFMWAAQRGMDVVNNSYFADPWLFNCRNDPEQRAIWDAERRAIRYAIRQGVTVVAGAANDNMDLSKKNIDTISPNNGVALTREVTNACAVVPAEVPGVITVSADNHRQHKAYYSNYGAGTIQVTAPGGDFFAAGPDGTVTSGLVLSTWPADKVDNLPPFLLTEACDGTTCGTYAYLQGTSMAAPHVTGVVALMISRSGKMNPAVVQARLMQTAEPLDCPWRTFNPVPEGLPFGVDFTSTCSGGPGHTSFYGAGEVDALDAVSR